jgi:hypothetical protein
MIATIADVEAHAFSGSYDPRDVVFLLKPIIMSPTAVAEKEAAIQSKRRHYSEMIGEENPPTPEYVEIYEAALARGLDRLASEAVSLASALVRTVGGPITLASLVRAGVPLGILLRRALAHMGADVAHFGVSIIRDRGLDFRAMQMLLKTRPAEGLVFVDGWTGKGAIATELASSARFIPGVEPRLVVLADPCGRAWLAASGDDWLIPSGILGASVSGLISRSILNASVGPDDFHACVFWEHLRPHDVSRAFIDAVWARMLPILDAGAVQPCHWDNDRRVKLRAMSDDVILRLGERFGVSDRNRIKPGIAEATRAVLRRVPDRVLVANGDDADLAAILHLARRSRVDVDVVGDTIAPYRAVTIIKKVS